MLLNLKILDESGNQLPVYDWNDLIWRKPDNSNYMDFTNEMMKITYISIHDSSP